MNASAIAAFGDVPFLDKGGATAVAIILTREASGTLPSINVTMETSLLCDITDSIN